MGAAWSETASKALRLAKLGVDRWLESDEARTPKAVFVLGCQRSGTTMLIDVLRRSPSVWVWPEKGALAYADYRLRSPAVVDLVTRMSPAPLAVYKPLCDSQFADRMLDVHAGSRALWAVRHWSDVARSAVAKWGPHQREVVEAIARGDAASVGWRGERVPPELVEQLAGAVAGGIDDYAGAVLFWYLRNAFFFSLSLHEDERIRLVRYDALLERPDLAFPEVFGHLQAAYSPAFHRDVRPSSGPPVGPEVPPAVRAIADGLWARFTRLTAAPG